MTENKSFGDFLYKVIFNMFTTLKCILTIMPSLGDQHANQHSYVEVRYYPLPDIIINKNWNIRKYRYWVKCLYINVYKYDFLGKKNTLEFNSHTKKYIP